MHPIGWQDIALRLVLAAVAGLLIGFDRGEHGRPTGMRTTLLVCLAAAIAMIQANLLLLTDGRPADSFVSMDILRLPLGVLTGVGFIGAGAIFRRDELVLGVTTAATLWFVTIIGLCFGAGQIGLGAAGALLALCTLSGLRFVELRIRQERLAMLTLRFAADGPQVADIRASLEAAGFRVIRTGLSRPSPDAGPTTASMQVRWRGFREDPTVPAIIDELSARPGIVGLEWAP